jgi:hypothetical protein
MDAAGSMDSSFGPFHRSLENAFGVYHKRPQALLAIIFFLREELESMRRPAQY